jgi:hypothetical protein
MSSGNPSKMIGNSFFIMGAIAFLFLFLWWDYVSVSIWPHVRYRIDRFIKVLEKGAFELFLPSEASLIKLPECLTPTWGLVLLNLRNILMYTPAALGFVLLLVKRKRSLQKNFVLLTIFIVSIISFVEALIIWAGPYRTIFLFAPFMALCIGMAYVYFESKWKYASFGLATLMIFSSLIGFWGHLYVPTHLYDPQVSWIEAGEHPVNWGRLKGFFDNYVIYENLNRLLTDEFYVLSLIVPPEMWERVEVIGHERAILSSNTMTVVFRRLNVIESYHGQGAPRYFNPEWRQQEFNQKLAMEKFDRMLKTGFNLVYHNGEFQTWWQ